MPIELTAEQAAVSASNDSKLVVTASAGSGKTTVLVERYLRHVLQDGFAPSQVWAVSFTHKAASEMRARILEALRTRGRFDLMEEAETGPIGTLDSLCERLLRENAIEAGLDPAYELLGLEDLARLVDETIKEALSAAGTEEDELDGLEGSLAGRLAHRKRQRHGELLKQIADFLDSFRNGRLGPEELCERYGSKDRVLRSWHLEGLAAFSVSPIDEPGLRESAGTVDFWPDLRQAVGSKLPKWLAGKLEPVTEAREAGYTARLVRIACDVWRNLEHKMVKSGVLDFSYQQRLIIRLLSSSELVRRRVGTELRALMVDEAQDMNPLQFALVDQLRIAIADGGFVTLVGDSKQSIYSFRQATPEQFDNLAREWPSLSLRRNHRSDAGIQRFIDSWSAPRFTSYQPMLDEAADIKFGEDVGQAGVEIREGVQFDPVAPAKAVHDLVQEGWSPGQIAVLSGSWGDLLKIGEELAKLDIDSQANGARTQFHAHLAVRDLAATLRALVNPGDDLAYLTVLRSPMADLSLDAIVELGLYGRSKKTSLNGGRMPLSQLEWQPTREDDLAKYETFSAWFEPLQKEAGRLPAWQVLSAILSDSGYLEAMASRLEWREALANSRKLLRMATEKPLLSASEFALEVRQIERLDHSDSNSDTESRDDCVTLSTIHSAKGLEFDAVVLAGTPRKQKESIDKLEIDLLGERIVTSQLEGKHPMLSYVRALKTESRLAEETRQVYVALTRARKRLLALATDGTVLRDSLMTAAEPRRLRLVAGGLANGGDSSP